MADAYLSHAAEASPVQQRVAERVGDLHIGALLDQEPHLGIQSM